MEIFNLFMTGVIATSIVFLVVISLLILSKIGWLIFNALIYTGKKLPIVIEMIIGFLTLCIIVLIFIGLGYILTLP